MPDTNSLSGASQFLKYSLPLFIKIQKHKFSFSENYNSLKIYYPFTSRRRWIHKLMLIYIIKKKKKKEQEEPLAFTKAIVEKS